MSCDVAWDGSHLGTIHKHQIIRDFNVDNHRYWVVMIGDVTITAIVRTTQGYVPCIIDELKPVFGLTKLGTHTVKIKSKLYILIRVLHNDDNILIRELMLNEAGDELTSNEQFRDYVRRVYVFRDTFAISRTFDSSITCRTITTVSGNTYTVPVSIYEPSITDSETCLLPNTVLTRWFADGKMPHDVLIDMLGISDRKQLQKAISRVRNSIASTIERISKDSLCVETIAIRRLTTRLCGQFADKKPKCNIIGANVTIIRMRRKIQKKRMEQKPIETENKTNESNPNDLDQALDLVKKGLEDGSLDAEDVLKIVKTVKLGRRRQPRNKINYRCSFADD